MYSCARNAKGGPSLGFRIIDPGLKTAAAGGLLFLNTRKQLIFRSETAEKFSLGTG